MGCLDLHHVAIRCRNLEQTVDFYTGLLDMKLHDRPGFKFPGAWLLMGRTMFHIYAGEPGKTLNGNYRYSQRSSPVDHIALEARGFDEMKAKVQKSGIDWRQARHESTDTWQLFVRDPSGVKIELNFKASAEPEGSKGPNNRHRKHVAGKW